MHHRKTTLTLPRLWRGSLPLPQCRRGALVTTPPPARLIYVAAFLLLAAMARAMAAPSSTAEGAAAVDETLPGRSRDGTAAQRYRPGRSACPTTGLRGAGPTPLPPPPAPHG